MGISLATAASKQPLTSVFEDFPGFNRTLGRLVQMVLFDPVAYQGQIAALLDQLPVATSGIIGEKLLYLLKDKGHRTEVADMMMEIGQGIVKGYTSLELPIRRMRYAV